MNRLFKSKCTGTMHSHQRTNGSDGDDAGLRQMPRIAIKTYGDLFFVIHSLTSSTACDQKSAEYLPHRFTHYGTDSAADL